MKGWLIRGGKGGSGSVPCVTYQSCHGLRFGVLGTAVQEFCRVTNRQTKKELRLCSRLQNHQLQDALAGGSGGAAAGGATGLPYGYGDPYQELSEVRSRWMLEAYESIDAAVASRQERKTTAPCGRIVLCEG